MHRFLFSCFVCFCLALVVGSARAWQGCKELSIHGSTYTFCVETQVLDSGLVLTLATNSRRFRPLTTQFDLAFLQSDTAIVACYPLPLQTDVCVTLKEARVHLEPMLHVHGCFQITSRLLGSLMLDEELGCF